MSKLTILGVGNILLSDEGAGVYAVQKLQSKISHPDIKIIDGGTLGLDLIGIFEETERLFIIDCVKGGGEPGTIYKFGLESLKTGLSELKFSLHDFNLTDVIMLAQGIGVKIPEITFYGVEPESFEWGDKLTPKVAVGVEKLIEMIVEDLKAEFGEEILKKGDV